MSHYSESPTLGKLFQKHPVLADQIREIVAKGTLPGMMPGSAEHAGLNAFLDRKPTQRSGFERESMTRESVRRQSIGFEAIVRMIGRPSLLVQGKTYVIPENASEAIPQETLTYIHEKFKRPIINDIILRTGRVDLVEIPTMPFVGTAWVVEKPKDTVAILATNRHVAEIFARADGRGSFRFRTAPTFRDFEPEIDFLREYDNSGRENIQVRRVRYIAAPRDPDIALLEIEGTAAKDLVPIEIDTARPRIDLEIGVVGYPAYDSRNDDAAIARYFGSIFNVKRFAFGEVSGVSASHMQLTHDATTLGGNSGSCIFDLNTGKAVGLHFAGDFSRGNFAVLSDAIGKALAGLTTNAVVRSPDREEAISDGRRAVSFYKGRDGYHSEFLGAGTEPVELPGFGMRADDVAQVENADADGTVTELRYRHFSVVMSKSRKLPLITAVNIDGKASKRVGRIDRWYVDGKRPVRQLP